MGGCASRPKESDILEGSVPGEAPTNSNSKEAETESVAQENVKGGENGKKASEESEAKKEVKAKEASPDSSMAAAEPTEPVSEAANVEALEKAPAEPPKLEVVDADKSQAASTSQPVKSDSPLVTL